MVASSELHAAPEAVVAPGVSVVVVNYYKAARFANALASLRRQSFAGPLKIAIVDNSVSQAEADALKGEVGEGETLVINERNEGYSKGCNIGVSAIAPNEYLLLSNPDVILDDSRTIEKLVALAEQDKSIGVLACIQRNDDGSVVENARRFPNPFKQMLRRIFPSRTSELNILEPLLNATEGRCIEVDWLQSSFVLVRKSLWDAVGGLDERYFVFMADITLCDRIRKAGGKVCITSEVTVRADGLRASSGGVLGVFRSRALRIHVRDAITYYWGKP